MNEPRRVVVSSGPGYSNLAFQIKLSKNSELLLTDNPASFSPSRSEYLGIPIEGLVAANLKCNHRPHPTMHA